MPRQRDAAAPPRPAESGISFGVPYQRPWENPVEAGHTHDPHEVTVQLDGVGRQLEEFLVRQAKDGQDADGVGDGPVFVDETGRRSRRYRRIGIAVGISCAVYAVVIVATLLSGNSNAPWLPVPGQKDEQPAGQVETTPLPAESVQPSDSAGVTPTPGAPVSAGVTPSQGSAAVTPGSSPSAATPGPSVEPRPSASASKPDTGVTTPDPDPEPSVTVSSSPEPSPSETGGSSPEPSESPATDGGTDTGTVADGTSEPNPIAESPVDPSATDSPSTGDPVSSSAPATSTA
ncbi:hypothetical protein RB628_07750 [Streptomyces sp. ADMS]|uniref:hypothetical protein n=1 Tax=Streptomyces sp. ADMS TaxID=3071415 RepID=UPI00296F932B|nr:hypothetical protein [Streptomyces sp. ADMS]MDW4905242.1 hypothetical protein [Streptomyces sp. ADMS]